MIHIDLAFIGTVLGVLLSASAIVIGIMKWANKMMTNSAKNVIKEEMATYTKQVHENIEALDKKILELNEKFDDFAQRESETNDMLKRSLLASSRDRINQAHSLFMAQKFIGAHSLFVLKELYASYKELGGNSFIDKQMEDIESLEVVSAEEIRNTEGQ